jgi:hypothetical protein
MLGAWRVWAEGQCSWRQTWHGMEWVNVVGLACDLLGAAVLAWGLFIDEGEALKLGLSYFDSDESDEPDPDARREKTLTLPPVADRLRQSRRAKAGLVILTAGFVLQIVANWPN